MDHDKSRKTEVKCQSSAFLRGRGEVVMDTTPSASVSSLEASLSCCRENLRRRCSHLTQNSRRTCRQDSHGNFWAQSASQEGVAVTRNNIETSRDVAVCR